ncbi:MAG: MFS transporter [Chloroflexi bacterium]|nr:MFS transporter [Chloroflexota bacterium]
MPTVVALAQRRRWITLIIACLAMLMSTLDQTIVNVALPAIQRDLGFDQASLAWIVDAYLIAFGGTLLLAGRLGDLIGRKRVFLSGVALFTAASLVCGLADSQLLLVSARFIQGLGAALSSSVIVAFIVTEFREDEERARAMSAYIVVTVGGGSIGLLLGGLLTQSVGWHWNFFINLPVGIATLIAGALLIRDNEGLGFAQGVDVGGSILATGAVMLGIYAILSVEQAGWQAAAVAGAGAVVLLGAFLALQARLANPIMPLRILRSRGLVSSSAVRGLTVVGIYGMFFLGTLYLERVRQFDTFHTGLSFLPFTLSVLGLSLGATARLMSRVGPRRTALIGIGLILAGLALFVQVNQGTGYFPFLFAGFALMGLGGGTLFTPLLTIAIADIPRHDAGVASGIVNVSQNVSAALAVALLGAVSSGYTSSLQSRGYALAAALSGGYHAGFMTALASVALGLALALAVLHAQRPAESAPQEAELAAAA